MLSEAEAIVLELAQLDAPINPKGRCELCGARYLMGGGSGQHDERCPWQLARRWLRARAKMQPDLGTQPDRAGAALPLQPDQAAVPCAFCDEPVETSDRGVRMNNGPFHHPCLIRSIFGSVGHLRRTCSCYGGTDEDPPGMTMRQAAQAAAKLLAELEDAAKASAANLQQGAGHHGA